MATIILNGVSTEVPDLVAKYITDIERDIRNAQASARDAWAKVQGLEHQIVQAVSDGEAKAKAAETRLMGHMEARAHSFFHTVDGDFRNVAAFLKHVASGLESHVQPKTLGAPGVQVSITPAPAAPAAPAASAAESSAPAPR